jgi:fatty acid desaturase
MTDSAKRTRIAVISGIVIIVTIVILAASGEGAAIAGGLPMFLLVMGGGFLFVVWVILSIMIPFYVHHMKNLLMEQNEILQRVDANLCKIAEGPNDQDQPTGQTVDRII